MTHYVQTLSAFLFPLNTFASLPALEPPDESPRKKVELILALLQVNLNFLALVENRTVPVRAKDVLMERALAILTLRPQPAEQQLLLVDLQIGKRWAFLQV